MNLVVQAFRAEVIIWACEAFVSNSLNSVLATITNCRVNDFGLRNISSCTAKTSSGTSRTIRVWIGIGVISLATSWSWLSYLFKSMIFQMNIFLVNFTVFTEIIIRALVAFVSNSNNTRIARITNCVMNWSNWSKWNTSSAMGRRFWINNIDFYIEWHWEISGNWLNVDIEIVNEALYKWVFNQKFLQNTKEIIWFWVWIWFGDWFSIFNVNPQNLLICCQSNCFLKFLFWRNGDHIVFIVFIFEGQFFWESVSKKVIC